jgi:hypothetical protein
MMNTLAKQILFTSLLISSLQVFAKGPTLNGQMDYSTPTNTTSGSKSGSAAALISKVVTVGVAGYTGSRCVSSSGKDWMACVMAAQSIVQITKSSDGSDNANNYGAQYKPIDPYAANSPNGTQLPYDPNNLNDPNNPNAAGASGDSAKNDPYKGLTANEKSQLQKLRSDLAHAGVSFDDTAGTIKLSDGKVLPLKSSPADLKAAGFDGAQIDKTLSDVQAFGSKLAAKATAENGGVPALTFGNPGGGSRGSANGNATNNNSNIDLNAFGGRKPTAIDKQGVAGLSRKLGDESIGVKGDNIFEMVNRRYRAQDKQNAFLRDK